MGGVEVVERLKFKRLADSSNAISPRSPSPISETVHTILVGFHLLQTCFVLCCSQLYRIHSKTRRSKRNYSFQRQQKSLNHPPFRDHHSLFSGIGICLTMWCTLLPTRFAATPHPSNSSSPTFPTSCLDGTTAKGFHRSSSSSGNITPAAISLEDLLLLWRR